MPHLRPDPIRVHGSRALVVPLLLVALVSPALRSGARASPVDPVPVGVWPLQPRPEVVRAFDPPDDPWGPGHRGVDLAGSVGERVRAALAGRVKFAGVVAGRGVVVVDHGPTRTTYEPVSATVRGGDVVARGQPIGALRLAGSHCLPAACLHWGWLRGDTYLDPLLLVGAGPVRLLPLWRGPAAPAVRIPVPSPPFGAVSTDLPERWQPSAHSRSRSSRVPRASPAPAPAPRSYARGPLLL